MVGKQSGWLLAWMMAAAVFWTAPMAAAQATKNSDEEYQSLIKQGVAEFGAANWEEARLLFGRSHEINPNARTLRGLGKVEFELRHYVASTRLLESALQERRNPLTEEQRQEVNELLSRARRFVSLYTIRLKPPTAALALDGMPAKLEPGGWIMLDSGEHTLSGSSPGYRTKSLKLDVRGGEGKTLSFELEEGTSTAATSTESSPFLASTGEEDEEGGVLTTWWFWTAAGVVATGIVVGVAVAASGGEERQAPLPGSGGVVVSALTRMP